MKDKIRDEIKDWTNEVGKNGGEEVEIEIE